MALPHLLEEKELTEGDPVLKARAGAYWYHLSMRNDMQSKMVSKPQANPPCATGICFINFLLFTNPMGHCTVLVKVQ